ncbi:protein of unknown function [Methylacidimicrobium sp. AP8]|nr:protein of unknown function [Methylacidimicrobium sp. AP8]
MRRADNRYGLRSAEKGNQGDQRAGALHLAPKDKMGGRFRPTEKKRLAFSTRSLSVGALVHTAPRWQTRR